MSYHAFKASDNTEYGSFEVFQGFEREGLEPGWYWWPCFPGCMPDGEANGPFESREAAIADARGE